MKKRAKFAVISAVFLASCLRCAYSPGCLPGSPDETLLAAGQARHFRIHLPPAFDGNRKLPAVIALHPFTGTGASMEKMTGFSSLADKEDFIAVYPNGRQRVWNADPGKPSSIVGAPADDVAFISALIAHLVASYGADPERIYMTGASSGGLMTHRIACELTGMLAAAAAVMITLPKTWPESESPAHPLPFLAIQGVADPFFPWEGGTVKEGPFRKTDYMSAEETVLFWAQHNGAILPPVETALPDACPDDGTAVFKRCYAPALDGAETVFYGVNGGGHTWPGSADTWLRFLLGRTSKDLDASRVIWEFFKDRSRNAQP